MQMVKSHNDGCWYPVETEWKYILSSLCDALSYFSEQDTNSYFYNVIDHLAGDVSDILNKT